VLKAHGFNSQVVALAEEKEAHSNDELVEGNADSAEAIYHIKEKESWAMKTTAFFMMVDKQHRQKLKPQVRYQIFFSCSSLII
jgi:hypothetical protein